MQKINFFLYFLNTYQKLREDKLDVDWHRIMSSLHAKLDKKFLHFVDSGKSHWQKQSPARPHSLPISQIWCDENWKKLLHNEPEEALSTLTTSTRSK